MVATQRNRMWMTVDEWRALERDSDLRHEYRSGNVTAIAGGNGDAFADLGQCYRDT